MLTFVAVFIRERSKQYDASFHDFWELRELSLQKYDKAYWIDLLSEYLHALKKNDV